MIGCTIKELPHEKRYQAAITAIDHHPMNAAYNVVDPGRIAVVTSKWWGERAKDLTIGFMEPTSFAMRTKILQYANNWGQFTYAKIRWTQTDPICRISFGDGGYYSYIGTDCLLVPKNQQTMNLQQFTVNTPASEWLRVVQHEFGHFLGCPHEHQRAAIIAHLNRPAVIAEYERTQGWSEQQIIQQVFTPLEERSLMGASPVDPTSIMAYEFDASLTLDGIAIPGGLDFSSIDRLYMGKIYPLTITPPPPPPPVSNTRQIVVNWDARTITIDGKVS